jgi:hypothetical protein
MEEYELNSEITINIEVSTTYYGTFAEPILDFGGAHCIM